MKHDHDGEAGVVYGHSAGEQPFLSSGLPPKQGLYDPAYEKDACGVGFVVNIKGKKGIRLHGANHMLEISDKVQFFTSSPVLFNGNLETLAPKSVSQEFNERPHGSFDQEVLLVNVDDTPAVGVAFELLRDDGNMAGKSAEDGSTQLQKSTGMDSYIIRYKGELP